MVLGEVEDAIGMIESEADDNADIIWGSVIKEDMHDEIRITVIATGFETQSSVVVPKPRVAEAQAVASHSVPFATPELTPVENLDVPTFMRRHAD
jgi:cell division protein FtsZ